MTDLPADPTGLVRSGYDRISEAYRSDTFVVEGSWYGTALRALAVRGYSILQEWLIPEGDGAHGAFLARSPGP